MSQNALRPRLADLALVTYLAPILQGRRVAVAGTTSGEVAQRLRALGAHTVVCFGGVGEDIAVRALTPGSIAAFHGKLDILVVPDATAVPSLVAVLDEARRALGSDGVVVVGAEAPNGPRLMEPTGRDGATAYHDLYDLCAARFANVRMVGRGPFVGYTLATFDDGSDRVALDTRLIDGDPARPESFIAVASDSAVALDPMALVQVPDALLETLREAGVRALREQLQEREQKLKEVEAASAERWVKIQRFEHGVKELEEENRKAREKVVRATKELEDERKLRQRVELEAQMSRRAPELPKTPDLAPELQRTKDELTRVSQVGATARNEAVREIAAKESALAETRAAAHAAALALEAARAELAQLQGTVAGVEAERDALRAEVQSLAAAAAVAQERIAGLERELDETQATEAELQAQLEEAQATPVAAAAPVADPAELAAARGERDGLKSERDGLTSERDRLKSERDGLKSERDGLKSERDGLAAALAKAEARAAQADARTRRAEEMAAQATTGDEVRRLESLLADRASELLRVSALRDDAITAVRELTRSARRPAPAPRDDARDALEGELRALRERVRLLEGEAVAFAGQSQHAAWRVEELEAALAFANARLAERPAAAPEPVRDDAALDALRAENVSLEGRLLQRGMELDGVRTSLERRVGELELEVDRLLRALEVVGAQTEAEARAQLDAQRRIGDALAAELQGVRYRLREAETALSTRVAAVIPTAEPVAVEVRADQALADLGRTAERLAATEEALRDLRARLRSTESDLAASRREQAVLAERVDEASAQLDDRDRREAAAEYHRREQLVALQDRLASAELRTQSLRELVASVRSSVSAILADGRGALVAHDLLQILRAVESSDGA
jgi:chromosome segregation ATPase